MLERLTTQEDWRWDQSRLQFSVEKITRRACDPSFWTCISRSFYYPEYKTLIELGCAPGNSSAQLVVGTNLAAYGVDFSENSESYLQTMLNIGKEATLYREDVLQFSPAMRFDVVCSSGLIEHFRGIALHNLLRKHDELLAPGGQLIIQLPNFTGLQYVWHYLFDKHNLDIHNVDSMQPGTFAMFEGMGYEVLYSGYQGQFEVWGVSRFNRDGRHSPLSYAAGGLNLVVTELSKLAGRVGIKLQGQALSPVYLFIARKPHH